MIARATILLAAAALAWAQEPVMPRAETTPDAEGHFVLGKLAWDQLELALLGLNGPRPGPPPEIPAGAIT